MTHTLQIIDGLMCLMDANGNIDDAAALPSLREARAQLQTWRTHYSINIVAAYRALFDHFFSG